MIRCAICDDEQHVLDNVKLLTESYFKKESINSDIRLYTDARQLLFDISDKISFDIAVLDIEMPYHNGLEIARKIKEHSPSCLIIFLTSYVKYAIDAFELEIFRYIPKAEIELRFLKYISEAVNIVKALDDQSYIVYKNFDIEKIQYKSIRYLRKNGKYTILYCTDNRETKIRKPINVVKKELNSEEFVTIDRGCIVNISYISKLLDYDVYLIDGERLPVSRSNIKRVRKIITCYWEGVL